MYTRFCLLLCLFMLLTGCMGPTQADIKGAYYGTYPENYKEIVMSYASRQLKDPDSATYTFMGAPQKGHVYIWRGLVGGLLTGHVLEFGYKGDVGINAKNSYGGYTGMQRHYYIIRDNQVVLYGDYVGY